MDLSNPAHATFIDDQALGTIIDNELVPATQIVCLPATKDTWIDRAN